MSGLRVMSFNVRGAFHKGDGRNTWEQRAGFNVATLQRYEPALIGFQELQSGNLEIYREKLSGYGYVLGPKAGNKAPHESNAIFFDVGQLEMLDSGGFWLSTTPERYSSSWRSKVVRCANWARFRSRRTGSLFLHLNTHLDHLSTRARLQGSQLILDKISEIEEGRNSTVFVTGDFNCPPGSAPYRTFIEADFEDTFLAAGNRDNANSSTFHAFGGLRHYVVRYGYALGLIRKPRRIDWILVRDPQKLVRVRRHLIVRDRDPTSGVYPSDHYPVLADLLPRTHCESG